jgi:hypothetical protein
MTRDELDALARNPGDPFIQGYACAVANLQRLNGGGKLTAEVKDLMRELEPELASAEAARAAGIDEDDIRVLFPPPVEKPARRTTKPGPPPLEEQVIHRIGGGTHGMVCGMSWDDVVNLKNPPHHAHSVYGRVNCPGCLAPREEFRKRQSLPLRRPAG